MDKRIFVVEDEVVVALEIQRALKKMGFVFAGMATHYEEAVTGIETTRPDLILLDIRLKQSKSGIEIAKTIKHYRIPFIYLTSITDESTMREAICTEPVGYLVKPFRREELRSTLLLGLYKASHTPPPAPSHRLKLPASYSYDMDTQTLYCGEMTVALGKKEHLLLQMLAKANGKTVPMHQLEVQIWNNEVVSESALRTLVYRLNIKTDYALIETIPLEGCRLLLSDA